MWFSLHRHYPTLYLTVFLHPSKKLLPAISKSSKLIMPVALLFFLAKLC